MSGDEITRREAIIAAAVAASAAALPNVALAQAPKPPALTAGQFLSARELAVLDEIAELIIPADAQSGGARAAQCAAFIDARLAESIDPLWRQSWKDDLSEIDELCEQTFGKGLLEAAPAQRQTLMEQIARNENNPSANVESSFSTIKWWVAEAYYTSTIGIHDELQYQGNVYIGDFIGTDISR
jgi:hypothetical protein